MSSDTSPDRPPQGGGDPWAAFGYLVAGVAFYGLLGWLLSVWLHAELLTPLGIVVGAGFGLYLVISKLPRAPKPGGGHPNPTADDASDPINDDRGDTA